MAEISDSIRERAQELGRVIGQSDEYKALGRARERINDDRETVQRLSRLGELEREVTVALQSGQEPSPEVREEYERLFDELQGSIVYQGLVAAQSNFDKILMRVNEEIERGMESGVRSRIILPS
ncbi:MAG TPA: YlbF family regulator [Longimicrobiales bacterium]|nr:YlbF family regulator [Longimicrobiales bacterium]